MSSNTTANLGRRVVKQSPRKEVREGLRKRMLGDHNCKTRQGDEGQGTQVG